MAIKKLRFGIASLLLLTLVVSCGLAIWSQYDEPGEVDLGHFYASGVGENSTYYIQMRVFVSTNRAHALGRIAKDQEKRIRSAIQSVLNSSNHMQLTDPGLKHVKTGIKDQLTKIAGPRNVEAVIIAEFSFMER